MTELDLDTRIQLIKDEYIMLQGFYEDIDNRCFTIKSWSISVGLAAIGAGFIYSEYLFLGAASSALLFWYLEGYWRGLSFFFARRILEIEAQVREGNWVGLVPLQVYNSWEKTFQAHGKPTWRNMRKEISWMPHVFIGTLATLLFIFSRAGWL